MVVVFDFPNVSCKKLSAFSERPALELTQRDGCLLRKAYFVNGRFLKSASRDVTPSLLVRGY